MDYEKLQGNEPALKPASTWDVAAPVNTEKIGSRVNAIFSENAPNTPETPEAAPTFQTPEAPDFQNPNPPLGEIVSSTPFPTENTLNPAEYAFDPAKIHPSGYDLSKETLGVLNDQKQALKADRNISKFAENIAAIKQIYNEKEATDPSFNDYLKRQAL